MTKQIRLNLILHTSGRHDAAWKRFDDPTVLVDDVDHQVALARAAEAAKFDAIFLPDQPAVLSPVFERKPRRGLDPTVLLSAVAMATRHLGLISTANSLHDQPYFVARSIATLQHISKGRAGWNVVTSQDPLTLEALGRPQERLDRATRYERAAEFGEIVTGLWESLPNEAIVADRDADMYIDGRLTKPVRVDGKHFSSSGVLQLPGRYRGDRPVLFQAGTSPQSRAFGATFADALFTQQPSLEHDRQVYAETKALAAKAGRNPDHLVVLPGFYAVVGDTETDARRRKAELDDQLDIQVLAEKLAAQLGLPRDSLLIDQPLPVGLFESFPTDDAVITYRRNDIGGTAAQHGFTVRELVCRNTTRGQRAMFATAEQIADTIIDWVDTDAADGFNINVDAQPDGLERFLPVLSILQERGRFRTEYEHDNFRLNFGLPSARAD